MAECHFQRNAVDMQPAQVQEIFEEIESRLPEAFRHPDNYLRIEGGRVIFTTASNERMALCALFQATSPPDDESMESNIYIGNVKWGPNLHDTIRIRHGLGNTTINSITVDGQSYETTISLDENNNVAEITFEGQNDESTLSFQVHPDGEIFISSIDLSLFLIESDLDFDPRFFLDELKKIIKQNPVLIT